MGRDKTTVEVDGRALLDRVLLATTRAATTVVVGDPRPVVRDVVWCREHPPGGGPAAALAAALPLLRCDVVVLLAADQPFLDTTAVERLATAMSAAVDGVAAVDADGSPQWLCSAWRRAALHGAGLAPGRPLKRTVGALRWEPLLLDARTILDCDTPDDLRRARELA
jgi:molybdopterin-guanine dinucleotide biosynthesis protein A